MEFEKRSRARFNQLYAFYVRNLTGVKVIEDKELQMKGHDVHLNFGARTIVVDEKVRARDYNDVLIEYISNTNSNRPGWIYTNESQLLAYLFPTNGFWLLDTQKIRSWVQDEKSDFWQLKTVTALNRTEFDTEFASLSKAVPFYLLEKHGFVFHKVLGIPGCS